MAGNGQAKSPGSFNFSKSFHFGHPLGGGPVFSVGRGQRRRPRRRRRVTPTVTPIAFVTSVPVTMSTSWPRPRTSARLLLMVAGSTPAPTSSHLEQVPDPKGTKSEALMFLFKLRNNVCRATKNLPSCVLWFFLAQAAQLADSVNYFIQIENGPNLGQSIFTYPKLSSPGSISDLFFSNCFWFFKKNMNPM